MDKTKIIQQFTDDLSNSSERVRKHRLFYCKMFLDFAGDKPLSEWDKTLVNNFLTKLEKEEKPLSAGSIRFVYGVVKRVFDAAKAVHEDERTRVLSEVNPKDPEAVAQILKTITAPGPKWDMGKRAAPKVEAKDMHRPLFTPEEMASIIDVAKQGWESVPVFLLSVYGLRCEEVSKMRPEYINLDKKIIFMPTVKGGEQRDQLLADEFIPYFNQYGIPTLSIHQVSTMYYRLEYKAGIQHREQGGLHQFRRYLDTALLQELGKEGELSAPLALLYAHIFLRWKISASSFMTERYFGNYLEVDQDVLKHHPVLPLWR